MTHVVAHVDGKKESMSEKVISFCLKISKWSYVSKHLTMSEKIKPKGDGSSCRWSVGRNSKICGSESSSGRSPFTPWFSLVGHPSLYRLFWCCFYRTRVRSLVMLVTHSLTHWLTDSLLFSKLDACEYCCVANTILISNSYNINKFWVAIFTCQGHINQVY